MRVTFSLLFLLFLSCQTGNAHDSQQVRSASSAIEFESAAKNPGNPKIDYPPRLKRDFLVIHVFVALCDNKYQGIVPVPAKLGDGANPKSNLYWGAGAGIKTWFSKKRGWKRLKVNEKIAGTVFYRVVGGLCFQQ